MIPIDQTFSNQMIKGAKEMAQLRRACRLASRQLASKAAMNKP